MKMGLVVIGVVAVHSLAVTVLGDCATNRPVQVWKLSTAPGAIPVQVPIGLSGDGCQVEYVQGTYDSGDPNNSSIAPSLRIRADEFPNGSAYEMTWWVFRPDGKDIDEILFEGQAQDFGREYRLIVAGPPSNSQWPTSLESAEALEFVSGTYGARHIRAINGYFGVESSVPKFDALGNAQWYYDLDGPITPDGFPTRVPDVDKDGNKIPRPFYNIRMRIGVSGDLGSINCGDLARVEARRVLVRDSAWLGSARRVGDDGVIPVGHPLFGTPLASLPRGDYLNVTGACISGPQINVYGKVGVILAGQIGDNGLPLGAFGRTYIDGGSSYEYPNCIFENWLLTTEGGQVVTLDGPERSNERADGVGISLVQQGVVLPVDPTYGYSAGIEREATSSELALGLANRELNPVQRLYEIREITTVNNESASLPGSQRTSGNIESKDGIESVHGSIGRIEARERIVFLASAKRGTLDYLIGRGGVGGPFAASVGGEGDPVGAMRVRAGFGGMELRAGILPVAGQTPDPRRGANMNIAADYFVLGERKNYAPGTIPRFFANNTPLNANGSFQATSSRRDGFLSRVVAVRGNDPVAAREEGNLGYVLTQNNNLIFAGLIPDPFNPALPLYDRVRIEGNLIGQQSGLLFNSVPNDIEQPIVSGFLERSRLVWIGGSFIGSNIFGSAGAVRGQLIINGGNRGGVWDDGSVVAPSEFGFVSPVEPRTTYINLSVPMGGGAAGVAPFRLHREDSIPANGFATSSVNPLGFSGVPFNPPAGFVPGTIPDENLFPTRTRLQLFDGQWSEGDPPEGEQEIGRIRLRMYGPIEVGTTVGRPSNFSIVAVEHSASPTFSNVTDVTGKFRAWIGGPEDPAPSALVQPVHASQDSGLLRDVIVRVKCDQTLEAGYYRVIRWEDRQGRLADTSVGLRCREVAGSPPVYPFALYFKLENEDCGLADVAGPGQAVGADGQLTADDIIVFLNWFFANDPRADIAGPGQSTIPDEEFTADDIIVFLNSYFSDCLEVIPPCPGTINWGGGSGGDDEEGGQGGRAAAPNSGSTGTGAGQSQAARIASIQAMIDAETNPQRRAVLESVLQMMQSTTPPADR